MFKSTNNRGFQMTFENGWTISVQFGPGNYCENRSFEADYSMNYPMVECSNAEIAIWDKDNNWFTFDNTDTVEGYCTPKEVADWIHRVSTWE